MSNDLPAERWSQATEELRITDWVHVTRPAAATTTGRERDNWGKAVDTPSLTCR